MRTAYLILMSVLLNKRIITSIEKPIRKKYLKQRKFSMLGSSAPLFKYFIPHKIGDF